MIFEFYQVKIGKDVDRPVRHGRTVPARLPTPGRHFQRRADGAGAPADWDGVPDLRDQPATGDVRCQARRVDRKSTRLNSSHLGISYAVFCLKKKKKKKSR